MKITKMRKHLLKHLRFSCLELKNEESINSQWESRYFRLGDAA